MAEPNFNWGEVTIVTTAGTISMKLEETLINVSGTESDYPTLSVAYSALNFRSNARDAIFYTARGECVQSIWVIRDAITAMRSVLPSFRNIADIGIVVELESQWVAITRTSHNMDAFAINFAPTKEQLPLPNSLEEWDESLFDEFQLERTWVRVDERSTPSS
jgi:hypothetical protein